MEFNYVRLNQYIFSTDLDFQIWMDQTRRFYTEADTVNLLTLLHSQLARLIFLQ